MGTGGYAIEFTAASVPGWEWLRSTASTGDNVYEAGKAYQDGVEKSSGTKDFVLALSSIVIVNQPTNLLFSQTIPVLTSLTNGTELGVFATEAPVERTWVYSLVAGAGDTHNSSFQISGDRLLTSGSFAGLGGSTLSFRAQTEDRGLSTQAVFQISVKTDSDNDGLADDWEEKWAPGDLSALNGDGVADADSDQLTDLEEYMLLFEQGLDMNPRSGDTDDDTLPDADELNGAGARPPTNPTVKDTDGDTLNDAVESNTGTFVDATDTGTDPTERDTDGDTLEDDVERATGIFVSNADPGTHPLTPDTDGDGLTDSDELEVGVGTDPLDWDSDDDTAGDGLEQAVHSTDPNNPGSVPSSFFWPVAKQTFSFTNRSTVGQTLISEVFGTAKWIELLRGEQLTLAFDISGNETANADDLDLRIGFAGLSNTFASDGYMNPAIDLGSPEGNTAVIRYRNDSDNYGGTINNRVVASTSQVPANGGIVGTTVNTVSFSLIRSDLGYTGVLAWNEIILEATITPVQYWGHPVWDKFHIRLWPVNSGDTFEVSNIRVIYGDAQTPYIRPITLTDVTAAGAPSPALSFSYPTDLGSSGYELQATSDLMDPVTWTPLLSNIPAGGATSTVSTVEVPEGDLNAGQRIYRIVAP